MAKTTAAHSNGARLSAMESAFLSAVKSGKIPGAVVIAKDLTGNIDYARSFGARSLQRDESHRLPPMEVDTPMRFASCTKLVTTVMALQCVERGLLTLDEAVDKFIPDLTGMKILTGFDDLGNPIMRERNGVITLRHLLTHTAGLSYVFINPLLREYVAKGHIRPAESHGIATRLDPPPVDDPGSDCVYGPSLDWVGRLVERANGMDLERYMQENVCDRLDITDMTFKLQQRPDLLARRAENAQRNKDDGKLRYDDTIYLRQDPEECFGGEGLFTSPESYMKILHSLLRNDGGLLSPATVHLMFQPALNDKLVKRVNLVNTEGPMPIVGKKLINFGLGGSLLMEDLDGNNWRRKGSLTFGARPNIIWQIDPAAGICTLVAFQLEPWNDPTCRDLIKTFEQAMYSQL